MKAAVKPFNWGHFWYFLLARPTTPKNTVGNGKQLSLNPSLTDSVLGELMTAKPDLRRGEQAAA
jgi:hypothetical protein